MCPKALTDKNILLPGVRRASGLEDWRRTNSEQKTVIFNFRDLVSSKQEAFTALVDHFGQNKVEAVKQVQAPAIPEGWIVIEAKLKDATSRKEAIERGLILSGEPVLAIPTLPSSRNFKASGLLNLPLESPQEAEARIRAGVEAVLRLTNSRYATIEDIVLQRDRTTGVYEGNATVILAGPLVNDSDAGWLKVAEDMPLPAIEEFNAYCSLCKTLNDHLPDDCSLLAAGRRELAAHRRSESPAAL